MSEPLRIFIGWDSKEPVAFSVLANSLLKHASRPISITPLVQSQLRSAGLYTRQRGPTESTEFSLTRFLVPYLSGYEGISIFMDCDMLCLTDIYEIADFVRDEKEIGSSDFAVWVCKHDYVPKSNVKFLNQVQTSYPKKNWSSLMIFNNARCGGLTPDYVNDAPGLDLHRFTWLSAGDDAIGGLPLEWNWLVGEYEENPKAKILHFTNGGPWFDPWFTAFRGSL